MSSKRENLSYEELRKKWEKDGFVIGNLISDDELKDIRRKQEEQEWIKENKRIEKELHHNRPKPAFLIYIADMLSKLFHIIVTLYAMAGIVLLLFGWQVYKAVSANGWQAVFQTKYTLYIVAYFVIYFVLKTIYFSLYKYANR